MKTFKNPLLLVLVWILSILSLCVSFIFYTNESITLRNIFGGTFLAMIYSAIFSFPAFIFFFLVSFFALRSSKLSTMQKKMVMCSANLLDIVFTFGALYLLIMADTVDHSSTKQLAALKDIFSFYPLWVLIVSSNIVIISLPFNFNKPAK